MVLTFSRSLSAPSVIVVTGVVTQLVVEGVLGVVGSVVEILTSVAAVVVDAVVWFCNCARVFRVGEFFDVPVIIPKPGVVV